MNTVLTFRVLPSTGEGATMVLTRQPAAPEDPQVLGRHCTSQRALLHLLAAYNEVLSRLSSAVVAARVEYATHRNGRAWGKATVTLDLPAESVRVE